MPTTVDTLLKAARKARKNARCGYSNFAVGAAIIGGGKHFTGCNIENASYGLTVCAERVALWKALSEGCQQFEIIAIVTDAAVPTPPCGPCRQLLWEYAGDILIVLGNLKRKTLEIRLSELFPYPFDRESLKV